MKLEKANETVWAIRRKDKPGKFICRSTEMGGIITRVSIALEKGDDLIEFDMSPQEFQSFFDILINFKNLVEAPLEENIEPTSVQNHYIPNEGAIAESKPWTPSISHSEEDEIEQLIRNFSEITPPTVSSSKRSIQRSGQIHQKVPKSKVKITAKISDRTAQISTSSKASTKERLKETDWDPW
ncbi:MAG: hypothetical protein K9W44_02440 [Candidatus Lokiarchaeota archaeon]|nr:hypothetical protein [Candidatus Harpocratesius repetitus]